MNLRSVAPSVLLGVVIGPVAAAVVDTPGQAPGGVTIYRCTDERGHLVALRDSPCRDGERQEAVQMQRPQDPPPRPAPIAPTPPPAAGPPHEVRIATVSPPQPMYECTAPDGTIYTSDSSEGNARWVPMWTWGRAVGIWPRPPLARPPAPPPLRPPGGAPPPPAPPPPRPPAVAVPGGTWVRDPCVRLPQQEVCRHLSDRRFEILRIYHAAMPSGRAELDREQARIDARMANDCPAS